MEEYSDEVSTLERPVENKENDLGYSDYRSPMQFRDMDILISAEQKKRIVETIFYNNEEKYQLNIKMFNWLESWEDASDLLDLILHSNKINPKSEEAQEFTSIVLNCFAE
jgi:hypothetical protein